MVENVREPPVLNRRSSRLSYGYEDFALDDVPIWQDVFDDRVEQRGRIVAQTIENDRCTELADRSTGIRPELSYECRARDLFKYAAYLDACATAIDRRQTMARVIDEAMQQSVFDRLMEHLAYFLHADLEEYELASSVHTFWNLQVAWVAQQCQATPITVPDVAFGETKMNASVVRKAWLTDEPSDWERDESMLLDRHEANRMLRRFHDRLLRMAANAGDEWAIQSYYPSREGDEYWRDLYRVNPCPMHRYATNGAGGRLDTRERIQHAIKAYELLKQEVPDIDVGLEEYVMSPYHMFIIDFDTSYPLPQAVRNVESNNSAVLPWLNQLLYGASPPLQEKAIDQE